MLWGWDSNASKCSRCNCSVKCETQIIIVLEAVIINSINVKLFWRVTRLLHKSSSLRTAISCSLLELVPQASCIVQAYTNWPCLVFDTKKSSAPSLWQKRKCLQRNQNAFFVGSQLTIKCCTRLGRVPSFLHLSGFHDPHLTWYSRCGSWKPNLDFRAASALKSRFVFYGFRVKMCRLVSRSLYEEKLFFPLGFRVQLCLSQWLQS